MDGPNTSKLSVFEVTLLRQLKNIRDEKELSKFTNVDEEEVTSTLDDLFDKGYIGPDSMVTERGFDLLNQGELQLEEPTINLTELEMLLLRTVKRSLNDKALSRLLKVDIATITTKLDKLYELGLITEKHMLTKGGFNVIHSSVHGPSFETGVRVTKSHAKSDESTMDSKVIVVQREILKVPCKYCGMLIDPVRDSKCPSCGANLRLVGR